jgi:CRP-like cAMP-binding protein
MTLTHDRKAELLTAAPLFAGVDADGLRALAERVVEVDYPKGAVIARQGDVGTGFFVVATGSVEVIRDGVVIATLGPGEFFGELSVLDHLPRTAQVIAAEPTTCLGLASWEFEAAVRAHPSVALSVMRGLASRLRGLTESGRH